MARYEAQIGVESTPAARAELIDRFARVVAAYQPRKRQRRLASALEEIRQRDEVTVLSGGAE